MKKIFAPVCIYKIILKYEPSYFVWSFLNVFTSSLLPVLYVYAPKLILEALTLKRKFKEVLCIILIYGTLLLLFNILNTLFVNKSSLASDNFASKLKYGIGKTAMSLSLFDIERASTAEAVNLAQNASEITNTVSYIGRMISNIITIIGLCCLIVRLNMTVIISMIALVLLKYLFSYLHFRYMAKARTLEARNERTGNYLNGLAYFNPGAEKEIRVNALQNWFINKVKDYRHKMIALQYRDFKYWAIFEAIIAVATTIQNFVVLIILAEAYMSDSIGIADFTMMFSAITTLTASFSTLGDQIALYNRQVLNANDYQKLLVLRPDIKENFDKAVKIPDLTKISEISFEHVSFTYPKSKTEALTDINIKIRNNEKIVIVGLNGAGKSTFIKLLCKFYKPTGGTIKINGTDIWSIPNDKYYPLFAAVFQDFSNFAFTVKENITLSEAKEAKDLNAILSNLGMEAYANKTDIYVTKNFSPDGIEPSGGENQKIAIARAIYKDAPVLILDEPTASLDVKAECEIYENFMNMAKGKTTIFISHRLACSKIADSIAVFENGRIVEYGNHKCLLKQNGLYAKMYRKQSTPYGISP